MCRTILSTNILLWSWHDFQKTGLHTHACRYIYRKLEVGERCKNNSCQDIHFSRFLRSKMWSSGQFTPKVSCENKPPVGWRTVALGLTVSVWLCNHGIYYSHESWKFEQFFCNGWNQLDIINWVLLEEPLQPRCKRPSKMDKSFIFKCTFSGESGPENDWPGNITSSKSFQNHHHLKNYKLR